MHVEVADSCITVFVSLVLVNGSLSSSFQAPEDFRWGSWLFLSWINKFSISSELGGDINS